MKEESKLKTLLKKNVVATLVVGLVLGLLIGMVIMRLLGGSLFIGKVNGKILTSKNLYNKMKNYYSIQLVLEDVDKEILDKKYHMSEEELDEIKETADYYIEQYEKSGYTEEEFLTENGFKNYDAFIDYLSVDYKRTVYYYDYLETKLEENAVQNYYNENAYGKFNNKHILVRTSDDVTEEQALAVANEIIERLNAGEEFDKLATEYSENNDYVITEDLGEIGAFDNLEKPYMDALKTLEKGKYTTTPVQTSYGYHVIYCVDKLEKTDKISNKDKMAIVNILAADADIGIQDNTLYYEALTDMRKKAKVKFFDKELKAKYEEYCAEYMDSNDIQE